MKKKILLIAAHPDDEVLGCGGTILKLAKKGHYVDVLLMTKGIVSRSKDFFNQKKILKLNAQTAASGRILKFKSIDNLNLPDNEMYKVNFLDIVKMIEKKIKETKPSIIFTHFENDLNVDHQITYRAVITATRPMPGISVNEVYSFETVSSTEWNYGHNKGFCPNLFVNIKKEIKQKISALKKYKLEMRKFPHARSVENIISLAKFRGASVGYEYAEAFKIIRILDK